MNHSTKGDNMIRSVNIQITNGKTNRPIVQLYPLEVTSFDMVVTAPATDTDTQNSTALSASQPTREAAKRSRQKTREWVDLL